MFFFHYIIYTFYYEIIYFKYLNFFIITSRC